MPLLISALSLPGVIAESFGPKGSFGIAVISLVTIVLGYGLLMVLWFCVFREKPEEKSARRNRVVADEREAAAMRAATHTDNSAARRANESPPRYGRPLKIEPRARTRFRRR